MEHLTKQQIVLLTLLVAFVTSVATGIVTVSLMDQGEIGITQVVNRIVERTVEKPAPAAAVIAVVNTPAEATNKVAKSVVRVKSPTGISGLGIILSSDGLILTDKTALVDKAVVELPDGEAVPFQIIQSEILGDVAFVAALLPTGKKLVPVTSNPDSASIQLGDKVYALSNGLLEEGMIKKVGERLDTSIPPESILTGSPLYTIEGHVIGFKTASLKDTPGFYPLASLKSITPVLSR